MSYDTSYDLTIAEGGPTHNEVAAIVAELDTTKHHVSPESGVTELEAKTEFWSAMLHGEDVTSWYDHDDHMREISHRFPGTLFTLRGNGDDQDDVWCAYYLGGLGVRHKQPTWEPPAFNPADLILTVKSHDSQAETYAKLLTQTFNNAGDLNNADPHPFNAAVDDLVSIRNKGGQFPFLVESIMTDNEDAFTRFGDGTILWFDYTGATKVA